MKFDSTINLETFVSMVYSIITAFILIIAYRQFRTFTIANNAQFLHNMSTLFFTEETNKLITIIHADCLKFELNNNNPVFKIDVTNFNKIYPNRNWELKNYYTTYEIDLLFLNNLDSLGSLVESNVIKVKAAHQDFGWFVNVALKNTAILSYLEWLDNYEKTSFVFDKLRKLNIRFQKINDKNN